ncbi:uncharacterized protein [Rutidosis leptorrhynchoides]|uniref:uncharacterized protein n=1 Tax=Rutidosis leptorrhynchoides TaxID=125765 RepID=UPI003A98EFE7
MLELKVAAWNIRGANNLDKQNEVKNLIQEEHLCICDVLETHLKTKIVNNVSNYIFNNWDWISNVKYNPNSCRIVVGWDTNKVRMMVLHMTKQVILCLVETVVDRTKFYCSFVYASNSGVERRRLWADLVGHRALISQQPLVILGDFNVTLKVNEHSAGGSYMSDEMTELQNCVNHIEVEDLCNTGFHFTWTKFLKNSNCDVLKKLDMILANEEFISRFSSVHAIFQP